MSKFKIGDEVFIRAAEANCGIANLATQNFDMVPTIYTVVGIERVEYAESNVVRYILAPEFGDNIVADASELAYYEDYMRLLDTAFQMTKKGSKTNEDQD